MFCMPIPSDLISVSAFICQNVLREEDGVLSAIRIADVMNVQHKHGVTPKITFFVVVFMKVSSSEPSRRHVSLRVTEPSGRMEILGAGDQPRAVNFGSAAAGHPSGATVVMEISVLVRETGTHWLTVLVDAEETARLPLTLTSVTTADG